MSASVAASPRSSNMFLMSIDRSATARSIEVCQLCLARVRCAGQLTNGDWGSIIRGKADRGGTFRHGDGVKWCWVVYWYECEYERYKVGGICTGCTGGRD